VTRALQTQNADVFAVPTGLCTVSRPEHSTGRVGFGSDRKTQFFRVEKILPMTVPWDTSASVFEPGPGLGGPPAYFVV
jgi:hypothetical protein